MVEFEKELESRAIVAKLSEDKKKDIRNYIQGAVYCFCKNCSGKWFSGVNYSAGKMQIGEERLYKKFIIGMKKQTQKILMA